MENRDTSVDDCSNCVSEGVLSGNSMLPLDEYVKMFAELGNRIRFEIVYRLVHTDDGMTAVELEEAISAEGSSIYYHLDRLTESGLIQKWQRTERGQVGALTYYQPSVYSEVILSEGVETLFGNEEHFREIYSNSK